MQPYCLGACFTTLVLICVGEGTNRTQLNTRIKKQPLSHPPNLTSLSRLHIFQVFKFFTHSHVCGQKNTLWTVLIRPSVRMFVLFNR